MVAVGVHRAGWSESRHCWVVGHRIRERGTHAELMAAGGVYRGMIEMQLSTGQTIDDEAQTVAFDALDESLDDSSV